MTKYVKLTADRSAFDSALYSVRPRQIRSLSVSDYETYHWFLVEEHYEYRGDRELYRYVQDRWELREDGKVHVFFVPEMIDLESRRKVVSDRITALRNKKLSEGLVAMGQQFDTRPETYIRVAGAVMKAMQDATFTTQWVTMDNKRVQLESADIIALGDAYSEFESLHVLFSRDLKDQVEASETPEQFDIQTGWPTNEFLSEQTLTVL